MLHRFLLRLVLPTVTLCALTSVPQPARAADPLPGRMPGLALPPRLRQPTGTVRVGSWVEYSLYDVTQRRRVRLHWALVGKIGTGRWWEMTFREARKPPLRIKTLIQGAVSKPSHIKRVIVQSGRDQALELPVKTGQKIMNVYLRRRQGAAIRNLGAATLVTAAGTFQTRHHSWKDENGQTIHEWTSPTAFIWGLVRFRSPRFRMELIRQGRGARSKIRGIPAKWHLPGR
ncbi:MAG: hypothetical protein ABI333_06205 [bacterium]